MGNQYVGLMIGYKTWQRVDKMASKRKVNTEALIESALLKFLRENEVITEPELMKRKIELGINEIINFIKTLDSQTQKKA